MLTEIAIPFAASFLLGYLTSMPLGPINLTIIANTLSRRTMAAGMRTGLGASLVDLVYSTIAVFGVGAALRSPAASRWIGLAGSGFLAGFGLVLALRALGPLRAQKPGSGVRGHLRDCLSGALAYLGNPFFIAFWGGVAATAYQLGLPRSLASQSSFVAGNLAGSFLWFCTLAWFTHRHSRGVDPTRLALLARALGAALFGIGLYGLHRTLAAG